MEHTRTLPVVLVGGLHSDARREVVEGLLRQVPRSVALHHDLSTAGGGIVLRTVRDASGELARGETPLVNDCACCALRRICSPNSNGSRPEASPGSPSSNSGTPSSRSRWPRSSPLTATGGRR